MVFSLDERFCEYNEENLILYMNYPIHLVTLMLFGFLVFLIRVIFRSIKGYISALFTDFTTTAVINYTLSQSLDNMLIHLMACAPTTTIAKAFTATLTACKQ